MKKHLLLVIGAIAAAAQLFSEAPASRTADTLIPVAGMSIDDGNITLAERTARHLLATLGINPADRARAEEILIRAELAKGNFDAALERVANCPDLPAERQLVFRLAALSGKKQYTEVLRLYGESHSSPDSEWGVSALRYALAADVALGNTLSASERFALLDAASGADARLRAANALAWVRHEPNSRSRAALLRAASQADRGGIFLDCALALPKTFTSASERKEALGTVEKLLTLTGLASTVEAHLALTAEALAADRDAKVAYARRAVGVAREENLRRTALSVLGYLLCEEKATATEGLDFLSVAVRLNPSSPEAPGIQLTLAEQSARLGLNERALQAYTRYTESFDVPELRTRVLRGRGRLLRTVGRPGEALAAFTEAAVFAQDGTERRDLLREAAEAAEAAERWPSAIGLYRDLLSTESAPGMRLHLARCYEASGDKIAAGREYAAIRDNPAASENDILQAVLRLGALRVSDGYPKDAIAEYSKAAERIKTEALCDRLILERARLYYTLGSVARTRNDVEALSDRKDPTIASEARFLTVLSLYSLGEDDSARTLARSYAFDYPDSPRIPDIVLWIAKSDFNRGEYAAARATFEDFVRRWPRDPRVPSTLLLAARAAFQEHNYAIAVERIGRLAKDHPDAECLADARFLQCEALMELARHSEARDILDALITRYPTADWIGEAYGRKADCLFVTATDDSTRYTAAAEAYREALSRLEDSRPDLSLAYRYKMGRILEKQNLPDDAAEHYTRLVYRVVANPTEYSDNGIAWFRKALTRLRAIDLARGNRSGFETLLRRVREAGL